MTRRAEPQPEAPRLWETTWGGEYIAVSKRGSTSGRTTAANFVARGRLAPGSRVLEMGCGHGRITELLVDLVPDLDITAIDVTKELLDNFLVRDGTNGCRLRLLHADLSTPLPVADGHFDAAVSARVFHYLPDPVASMREARRVVRPGGRVVLSVPNRLNPIKRLTYRRARLYSPSEVAGWFSSAGFHDVSGASMCFFPSASGWNRLASAVERCSQVPLVGLAGGSVVAWGTRPQPGAVV